MKTKMIVTLIIEGQEEDIHEIKGSIITTASECLISMKADVIEEPKEIRLAPFMQRTGVNR